MIVSKQRKVLLLTKQLDKNPQGGRELLCKLNHEVLRDIYGDNLSVFELPFNRLSGWQCLVNAFRGHIDGLNAKSLQLILSTIQKEQINLVFVDGSNLGSAVAQVKRYFPTIEVVTFFHNVEARFFWGAFLTNKTVRSLGVLLANFLAERKTVHNSDKIVCLSARDGGMLKWLYGGDVPLHISPIALVDKCPPDFHKFSGLPPENFALFVGGSFYANYQGIVWFIREVSPRINLPIYIVGRGFETLRNQLEVPGKVIVVGAVDCISHWYLRAQFVVAPIFDGSGMKTKVAEALMFGKLVIGTPEAFSGYENISAQAGWVCGTRDEFVEAIESAQKNITSSFDVAVRQLYISHYSQTAAKKRFISILKK